MKVKRAKSPGKVKGKPKKKIATGMSEKPGKGRKDIADMTVDDMFSMIQDDDDDFGQDEPSQSPVKKAKQIDKKKTKKKQKGTKEGKSKKAMDIDDLLEMEDDDEESLEGDEEMVNASSLSREEYLKKLKKSDPTFYATLMQSKDIMDLKGSDEEDDENDDDDEEEGEGKFPLHNGLDSQDAEEDGEESDFELDDMDDQGGLVTASMIAEWEEELKGPKPFNALMDVQQALLAAIQSLSSGKNNEKEEEVTSKYKVQGSQRFNAIIRLCLRYVAPALYTLFQLKDPKQSASKSKKWNKLKNTIKLYLRQLIALAEVMTEPTVAQSVLSRGILPVIPFYAGHPGLGKLLARRLVSLWATSNQKVRVFAFLAMYRLTQILQGGFLDWILKKMYMAYVQNCRFTSPNTWGVIDFMRLSLVEMYSLDASRAYQHAFVYIRQMALHLRNAIQVPKKERIQLVYNWQFIHCLHLWCDLLGKTHPNPALQPMIFPVTQVAIGAIKLQPIASFFPLVFHICRMLTELSKNTSTFIPVLPFALEALNKAVLKKEPKKASIRPFDWMCMLRLSKGQLAESAFKDGVVDQVYDIMISYLSMESYSIGFPDLVVPVVWQLKMFVKKCKFQNYNKKFKQLIDKVTENSNFIEERRKGATFGISDTKAVRDWEISVRQAGTPLSKYYESWRKVREKEQQQRIATTVSVNDFDLAAVKKRELENKGKDEDIFASDEEEDIGVTSRETMKNVELDDDEDEEDMDDDDDDYDSEEDANDDISGKEPPKKKAKKDKNAETTEEDFEFEIPKDVPADVVKAFDFSDDDDDDDGPDQDDYGVASDSDS